MPDPQTFHVRPVFLPDGRHFLFLAIGMMNTSGIYLGALDSPDIHRLTPADASGVYLSPGWLLWARDGTLVAQRLDLDRQALTDGPVTLADPVVVDSRSHASPVSVSATGLVAYRTGGTSRRQLTWVDRFGKALSTLGAPDENDLNNPRVSPDGHRVAVSRTVQGNTDIWLLDGTRPSRFTTMRPRTATPSGPPTAAGSSSTRTGRGTATCIGSRRTGPASEELLVDSTQKKAANDWSADGRFLLYNSLDPQTDRDLLVLQMDSDRTLEF